MPPRFRRPRRFARRPCFTSGTEPRSTRRCPDLHDRAISCGSARVSICARSRPVAALRIACQQVGLKAAPDAAPRRVWAHDEGVDVLCHLGWEEDLRPGTWGFIGQGTVGRSDSWSTKIKEPSPREWKIFIGTRVPPSAFLAVPHHVERPTMAWLTSKVRCRRAGQTSTGAVQGRDRSRRTGDHPGGDWGGCRAALGLTSAVGQRSTSVQLSQTGARARHTRRPCAIIVT